MFLYYINMIYKNICESIGNTPLIKLEKIKKLYNLPFDIYAKLERSNPSGSIKDRAAFQILKEALDNKIINHDTCILEATSGNMGISLAMICAYLDLKLIICMPENASKERILMMEGYGAKVILTKKEEGMNGSVKKVNELHQEIKNSYLTNQFSNKANINAHYLTTSREIYEDLHGKIDVFICGFGTSGTLIGCGKYFKEKNKNIKIIGIEPASSSLVSGNKAGSHKIQGIGANFVPELYKKDIVDDVITVSNEQAYEMCNILAKKEGIFVGISSGANIAGILKLDRNSYRNCNIVTVLPDNGERYLSVDGLFK